jgi:hypothetical protein
VIEYCEFREELAHLCDAKAISNDNNADENARKRYNLARTCMRDNALIEFKPSTIENASEQCVAKRQSQGISHDSP